MAGQVRFLTSIFRVMLLRGSPERILYDRWLLRIGLGYALIASMAVQWIWHGDGVVFVILQVFAEVTLFMLWMVLLTAKIGRLRLASLIMVLVWMSALADSVLVLAGIPAALGVPVQMEAVRQILSVLIGVVLLYGASNAVSWGLRKPIPQGALQAFGYAAAVWGLVLAFQTLFNTMAA